MTITMVEIAKRTNLSPATVSRVLNGKGVGFISSATRQRVLEAARDLGYEPNRVARGLEAARTLVVGAWIRNPDRSYYSRILRSLLESANRAGYDMIVTPLHDQLPNASGRLGGAYIRDNVASWPVDGVFIADCLGIAEIYTKRFAPGVCPVVGLGSEFCESTDYVGFDMGHGVRQAVEHLISIGCRRIAHLSTMTSLARVRTARSTIYEETLAAAGMSPELVISADETRAAARSAIRAYVQSHGAPDGLFCLNDDMAIGAYRELRDQGLRIPEDVRIVGCDGIEDGQYLDSPLTTVVQPVQEMCRLAWEVMLQRMENPNMSLSHTLLKPELRIDASTRR